MALYVHLGSGEQLMILIRIFPLFICGWYNGTLCDLYVNTTLIVLCQCLGRVCAGCGSVYMFLHVVCMYVCPCAVGFCAHFPSRKSVKHGHYNSSQEKWGDFQLECREGVKRGLQGEVAICCDGKKMGALALFYCSDCRRIPPR